MTFQRTTKTSNAMKYKMHILDMTISPCLLQPANSTELSILTASPAILIMILVWSLFQLQWFLMKLVTVMMWHSQITTNWSSLHKKLIQLSIDTFHFWFNGCARQFRSTYVFHSFFYNPANIKLTWNHGEAHDFKGMFKLWWNSVLHWGSKYLTLNCWRPKSWMPVTRQTIVYNFNYTDMILSRRSL